MNSMCESEIEKYDMENEDEYRNNSPNSTRNIHTYKCTLDPHKALLLHKPIAFIESDTGEFIINVAHKFILKLTMGLYDCEKCGLHYYQWKIDEYVSNGGYSIQRSCMLLPLLSKDGLVNHQSDINKRSIYTSIADDYTEIDRTGRFAKPSLHKTDFTLDPI